jgi:hypothetical protein
MLDEGSSFSLALEKWQPEDCTLNEGEIAALIFGVLAFGRFAKVAHHPHGYENQGRQA